ncbi:hypothetical protein HDU82_002837 [Entophlyctis luteolus]|nr:hypothetical protein HDU82_002837 [Entophlyctis luteolus]
MKDRFENMTTLLAFTLEAAEATEKNVEAMLWKQVYAQINTFRAQISSAKKARDEERLATSRVLFRAFLDEVIVLYGRLIVRLSVGHDLARVKRIILRHSAMRVFDVELDRKDNPCVKYDKGSLVMCCFQSLIYLGDLARYRETVAIQSPAARFYYMLAHKLVPSSGNPFNQLAVITVPSDIEGGDLVHAELYIRALCCRRPFATAQKNLELCLSKPRVGLEGIDELMDIAKDYILENNVEQSVVHSMIQRFEAILLSRKYNKSTLQRFAGFVVGLSQMMLSRSRYDAFNLMLLVVESIACIGRDRLENLTQEEYSFNSVEDLTCMMKIFLSHIQICLSEGVQIRPLFDWSSITQFCNRFVQLQLKVPVKFSANILDPVFFGFLAVDRRLYNFNPDGDFDDGGFGEDDSSAEYMEGAAEYQTDHGERDVQFMLSCLHNLSTLEVTPFRLDGVKCIMIESKDQKSKESLRDSLVGRSFVDMLIEPVGAGVLAAGVDGLSSMVNYSASALGE